MFVLKKVSLFEFHNWPHSGYKFIKSFHKVFSLNKWSHQECFHQKMIAKWTRFYGFHLLTGTPFLPRSTLPPLEYHWCTHIFGNSLWIDEMKYHVGLSPQLTCELSDWEGTQLPLFDLTICDHVTGFSEDDDIFRVLNFCILISKHYMYRETHI